MIAHEFQYILYAISIQEGGWVAKTSITDKFEIKSFFSPDTKSFYQIFWCLMPLLYMLIGVHINAQNRRQLCLLVCLQYAIYVMYKYTNDTCILPNENTEMKCCIYPLPQKGSPSLVNKYWLPLPDVLSE